VRRKSSTRMLNGIPLKRRMVWLYDLDSPEYKARRKKDLNEIRRRDADRDGNTRRRWDAREVAKRNC